MLAVLLRFVGGLVLFVPLERLFPHRPDSTPLIHRDRVNDLLNIFGNFVLWVALFRTWSLLVPNALGWAKPYVLSIQINGFLLVVAILATESFLYYWGHRLLHASPLLWRFHSVHHSLPHLDWLAGFRGHVFETCYFTAFASAAMFLLNLPRPTMFLFLAYRFVEGQIEHSNVRVPLGPLKWVVPSPWFHHWHHSVDAEAQNKNFSPYPIWDVLFRTAYMPAGRLPTRFGVDAPVPDNYLGQVAYPFGFGDRAARLQRRIEGWVRLRQPQPASGKEAPEY